VYIRTIVAHLAVLWFAVVISCARAPLKAHTERASTATAGAVRAVAYHLAYRSRCTRPCPPRPCGVLRPPAPAPAADAVPRLQATCLRANTGTVTSHPAAGVSPSPAASALGLPEAPNGTQPRAMICRGLGTAVCAAAPAPPELQRTAPAADG